jgi:molecular chaperone DnaK (HSP70)
MSSRYVVGIDLGTTNTALAWVEPDADGDVHARPVTQLVGEGVVAERPQLPSFVYLAGEHDLPPEATALPWDPVARLVVGELARAQGAKVPGRMIASAKSWLCHPGVDRAAAILPWGAEGVEKRSPIEASARILLHAAAAWQHQTGQPLADAEIILTVPASFDEVARELTLDAARRAGLDKVTLLEEPQAVFYAWIDQHPPAQRRDLVRAGERILVCDVGGGTTDFTLIEVGADGDSFERTAVGDHLLLGGDNIDVALGRRLEARLGKLDAVQWHGLVHACRLAKEQILAGEADRVPIAVTARGARLIGGILRGEVTREEVETLVLDGFFPRVARDERPARARAGLVELGLPYAADPAVTRHLAAFLARHEAQRIDAVLFNGGAMTPALVRDRVLDQLALWQPDAPRPRELGTRAPALAVAHGAAYYGLVRRGLGARIRGGAARAFYVGVDGGRAVCVLPRGAEEGVEHELAEDFAAVVNRPVSFRLFSSSVREDRVGEVVAELGELAELPPLVTALRAPGQRNVRVRIRARLTELGTLELWCQSVDVPDTRWRLSFDLRAGGAAESTALPPRTEEARALVRTAFAAAGDPAPLVKQLEQLLEARRDEWSTALIRALWDTLHESEPSRALSADVEARWLNLAGFLLRPGVGAPLDDWRVREMWKVFNAGLRHDKDESCRLAWWITWRRIGAGLKRTQQEQFYDRLAPLVVPSAAKKKGATPPRKVSPQELGEIWRCLAGMERLHASVKTRLGEALLERLAQGKDHEVGFWALGRLGARVPLYGPADVVVPASVATAWLERLLTFEWKQPERILFPAAQLGRLTGDRARDLAPELRGRLAERLRSYPGGERTAKLVEEVIDLEAREERVAFGDSLPSGLKILEPPPDA